MERMAELPPAELVRQIQQDLGTMDRACALLALAERESELAAHRSIYGRMRAELLELRERIARELDEFLAWTWELSR